MGRADSPVTAPASFGKSTLAQQIAPAGRTLWCRLRPEDRDRRCLLGTLVAAGVAQDPPVGRRTQLLLASHRDMERDGGLLTTTFLEELLPRRGTRLSELDQEATARSSGSEGGSIPEGGTGPARPLRPGATRPGRSTPLSSPLQILPEGAVATSYPARYSASPLGGSPRSERVPPDGTHPEAAIAPDQHGRSAQAPGPRSLLRPPAQGAGRLVSPPQATGPHRTEDAL
jgi:hypothetical protein